MENCGFLSPFEGKMYRAQVLGLRIEGCDSILTVFFPDWGNIADISYYKCKYLARDQLYPANAFACQVKNVTAENWNKDTVTLLTIKTT